MVDREAIESGLEQMDYELIATGNIELPTSKPATYMFTEPATYDPERFESRLRDKNFAVHNVNTKQKSDGSFYYFANVVTDHYKSVNVKIWQEECCIYRDEESPDLYELSRILHAIEDAFAAELAHSEPESDNE